MLLMEGECGTHMVMEDVYQSYISVANTDYVEGDRFYETVTQPSISVSKTKLEFQVCSVLT